jgi:hypothetical protein
MSPRSANSRERGAVLVIVAVLIVALIGFAALVVDIGKLYKVRSELQNASDSAAHAGAVSLDRTAAGINAARDNAKAYALLHNANRSAVVLADEDILFGHWDEATRTFTSLGSDPTNPAIVNAVRVIDRRQDQTQNPVLLDLAPLLGKTKADVHSDAIAVAGGPRGECGFPMVVPDCTLTDVLDDGTCDHCMTYQDNNTDNAGWTSFDTGSVGGPTISALITAACFDSAGNVAIDPNTLECTGTCNDVVVGDEIKVQNGNLMNQGNNNFCTVIQTILTRGIVGGPAQPFVVRAPVLESTPGSACDASQFSSFHTIAGFAAFEIFGAKCGNADPGVFATSSPCTPPSSGKYIVGALRCDLESVEGVAGSTYFGIRAKHIRLVE